MPHHFRDRVILVGGNANIPQLPSGVVVFNVGAYRINTLSVSFNPFVPTTAVGTTNLTGAATTADLSASLNSMVPTTAVSAHSP